MSEAFYPRLLPIARNWAARLGKPAPWPDSLADWLHLCHEAGQDKSAQILLRDGPGDWNALHRDVFGDMLSRGHYVEHQVFFTDEATAVAAGYRPCAVCLPAEYTRRKTGRQARRTATSRGRSSLPRTPS